MLVSYSLSLAALLGLIARDVPAQSVSSLPWLFGGAALLWLPSLGLEALASRGRVPDRAARALGWLCLGLVPALYPCAYFAPIRFAGMRTLGIGTFALFVASALGFWLLPRLSRATSCEQRGASTVLTCAGLCALFFWLHLEETTLSLVNPGSERVRSLAYLGTWALSLGLVPALVVKSLDRYGEPVAARLRVFSCVVCLGVGVVALEADRRFMQDDYQGFHAWLQIVCVVALEGALSLLATAMARALPQRAGVGRIAGLVSLVAAIAMATLFLAGPWVFGPLPAVRSRLAKASIGALVLRLQGDRGRTRLPALSDHPLLHTPLFHDVRMTEPPRHLLLITIDALRSDAVGKGTPFLQQLAAEGASFPRTYSPGSRTAIGLSALMTGRYSAHLAWQIWTADSRTMYLASKLSPQALKALGPKVGYTTFPDFARHPSLATRMKAAGFHTMATPYLAEKAKWVRKGVGFERGFDDYTEFHAAIPGRDSSGPVIRKALAQIDRAPSGPWFQWVHLFDPHRSGSHRARYRGLVKSTDAALGTLIEELQMRGLWEDTAIVITGDHGEGFGPEHALSHGSTLYDDQTLVPLIVRIPGLPPRKFAFPSSSLDGVATLLALANADLGGIDGMNLIPLIRDGIRAPKRPIFTELHRYVNGPRTSDLKAVILDDHKLTYDRLDSVLSLYNVSRDPRELHDRLEERPDLVRELSGLLGAFVYRGEREFPLP